MWVPNFSPYFWTCSSRMRSRRLDLFQLKHTTATHRSETHTHTKRSSDIGQERRPAFGRAAAARTGYRGRRRRSGPGCRRRDQGLRRCTQGAARSTNAKQQARTIQTQVAWTKTMLLSHGNTTKGTDLGWQVVDLGTTLRAHAADLALSGDARSACEERHVWFSGASSNFQDNRQKNLQRVSRATQQHRTPTTTGTRTKKGSKKRQPLFIRRRVPGHGHLTRLFSSSPLTHRCR